MSCVTPLSARTASTADVKSTAGVAGVANITSGADAIRTAGSGATCTTGGADASWAAVMGDTLANELQGSLRAISLCEQAALNTAFSNDIRPSLIYAQQVQALGDPGDVLLGISTSGQAENVCYALIAARAAGMAGIGLTGAGGGRMASLCDVIIRVPATRTYEVQEYHLPIYHALCAMLESHFFYR